MGHATFTFEYYDNVGSKTGLSNIANVVHSVDAYVLRCMHRRCNYNAEMVNAVNAIIQQELVYRATHWTDEAISIDEDLFAKVQYYVEQYTRSTLADIVILPYLDPQTVKLLSTGHLEKLSKIIHQMLQHRPFAVVAIHDEYKCLANYVDWMRWHYKEILADIADSNVLDDLLSQLYGEPGQFIKLSSNLGDKIRGSAYALC